MRTGTYLATFTPGTKEPHPFSVPAAGHSQAGTDLEALRRARAWRHFSELFRRTDTGFVRIS
jgi:hypothetical protein